MALWQLATGPVNLPLTVALGLVLIYWLIMTFSGFDQDSDVDFGLDGDMELGSVLGFLSFFNIGTIPLSILLSVFVFVMWATSMLVTGLIPAKVAPLGLLVILPNMIWAGFATKWVTQPLAKGFRKMKQEEKRKRSAVAKIGYLLSDNDGERLSQCEIPTDGAPYRVNVKTRQGVFLPKNTRVLIIEKSEENNFYYVENTEDLEI